MHRREFVGLLSLGLLGCKDENMQFSQQGMILSKADYITALASCIAPSAYDIHAQLLITEMEDAGATPNSTRKGYISDLFTSLKASADNFSKLACLQIYAGPTDAASLFNWVDPYVFIPTKHGTLTFNTDRGYTGNGTTGYINTNFKDTLSHLTLQDDICVFAWNLTNDAQTTILFGTNYSGGTSQTLIQPKRADTNKAGADLYSASPANQTTGTITDASGLWTLKRTGSTQFTIYRNGSSVEVITASSVAMATKYFYYVLASNNGGSAGGFSSRQCALWGIGSGSIDVSELHSSLSTYLTAIGAI